MLKNYVTKKIGMLIKCEQEQEMKWNHHMLLTLFVEAVPNLKVS